MTKPDPSPATGERANCPICGTPCTKDVGDMVTATYTPSETAPKGQHLSADLQEALHLLAHMARIVSATRKEAFAEWALPNSPYEMVKAVEEFIVKPRSVFAPSAIAPTEHGFHQLLDSIDIGRRCSFDGGKTWKEYSFVERLHILIGAYKMLEKEESDRE